MLLPNTVGLRDKFLNLDDEATYAYIKAEAASDKARNFVVEFSLNEARIAFDLDSDDLEAIISQKVPDGMVRWINIWSPNTQRPAVERIGNHYGFSQRLQALMTSPAPFSPQSLRPKLVPNQSDVELGFISDKSTAHSQTHTPTQVSEDLAIYQLVKETVNYTSIDQGKQCIHSTMLL